LTEAAILTDKKGRLLTAEGDAQPACRQKGTINDVCIGLMDANLDGKYTQDGSDAICIGTSQVAQPLGKIHLIGQTHYRMSVAEDGNSIEYEPITGKELAVVRYPLESRYLKTLVLTSKDGKVYDLVTAARVGLLPGTYKLSHGLLASSKYTMPVLPTKTARTYELKAGKENTLRIGAPVRMYMSTKYSKGEVLVSGYTYPLGDGGEEYMISLRAGEGVPAPEVGFYEGRRKLAGGRMGYG
jgi:hypothetical protein